MDIDSAKAQFVAMSETEQAAFLVRFGHNLTIAARDTYIPDSVGVHAPERLREINEVQHRLLGHIEALLADGKWKYPDDALIHRMLDHTDEPLRSQAMWAFEYALRRRSEVSE